MERIIIDGMEFLKIKDENINILISTAENDISFKFDTETGIKNIKRLNKIFHLKDVNYLKQTHSDIIIDVKNETLRGDLEGDGLIIHHKDIACGVFTADCVPVIIYDKHKGVVASVHSGWKGTFNEISKKACIIMRDRYGCKNIKALIGPHIRSCCYEVSQELLEKFTNKFSKNVAEGRNLNLEECIKEQLKGYIDVENIQSLNLCTYCNEEIPLHSYRKNKEDSGRLFSMVYIK